MIIHLCTSILCPEIWFLNVWLFSLDNGEGLKLSLHEAIKGHRGFTTFKNVLNFMIYRLYMNTVNHFSTPTLADCSDEGNDTSRMRVKTRKCIWLLKKLLNSIIWCLYMFKNTINHPSTSISSTQKYEIWCFWLFWWRLGHLNLTLQEVVFRLGLGFWLFKKVLILIICIYMFEHG